MNCRSNGPSLIDTVRETLDACSVAERYGINTGAHGRIRCLFHEERNPAMKLYSSPGGGFYCFACGAHGTVIDLAMKLFDLPARQAAMRLAVDFGIAAGRSDGRAAAWLRDRREKEKRLNDAYQKLRDADRIIAECAPASPSDAPADEWIRAIHDRTYYEYLCNALMEEGYGRKRPRTA